MAQHGILTLDVNAVDKPHIDVKNSWCVLHVLGKYDDHVLAFRTLIYKITYFHHENYLILTNEHVLCP